MLQLGSNWQVEANASPPGLRRIRSSGPDFLPTLFEERDLCEQGSESCYEVDLSRKARGGQHALLSAPSTARSARPCGSTSATTSSTGRRASTWCAATSCRRCGSASATKLSPAGAHDASSRAWPRAAAARSSAADRQPYENQVRYMVTSLDTQFLRAPDGRLRGLPPLSEQQLDSMNVAGRHGLPDGARAAAPRADPGPELPARPRRRLGGPAQHGAEPGRRLLRPDRRGRPSCAAGSSAGSRSSSKPLTSGHSRCPLAAHPASGLIASCAFPRNTGPANRLNPEFWIASAFLDGKPEKPGKIRGLGAVQNAVAVAQKVLFARLGPGVLVSHDAGSNLPTGRLPDAGACWPSRWAVWSVVPQGPVASSRSASTAVRDAAAAWRSRRSTDPETGLRPGDQILLVNGAEVGTPRPARAAPARERRRATLTVLRGRASSCRSSTSGRRSTSTSRT